MEAGAASLDTALQSELVTGGDYLGPESPGRYCGRAGAACRQKLPYREWIMSGGSRRRYDRIYESLISRPLASRPIAAKAASDSATTTTVIESTAR